MSREHLYKAKRVNWRELPKEEWWVEGALFEGKENSYMFINVKVTDKWENSEIGADVIGYLVDTETAREYIGLPDKHNRKIFEGDIVLINGEDEYFAVEWDNDTARFVMDSGRLIVDFDNYWNYQVEVIGNIFDNTELLKEGESKCTQNVVKNAEALHCI